MEQTTNIQLRELTVRYTTRRDSTNKPLRIPAVVRTVDDCGRALMPLLHDEASEVFAILCLSTKLSVLAYHEVSRGSLDTTIVHPREVFKAAILANAASIVLGHYVTRYIMRVMCPRSLCGGGLYRVRFPESSLVQWAHNEPSCLGTGVSCGKRIEDCPQDEAA